MTTRRNLLTGTVAVVAAPLLPLPAMALSPADDPAVALGIRINAAREVAVAASARAAAIYEAAPKPIAGDGLPAVDTSLPCWRGSPFANGRQVSREKVEAGSCLSMSSVRAARLAWWDWTMALMERRAIETGFHAASEESERAWAVVTELEARLADVSATTMLGVIYRLRYPADVISNRANQEELYPYEGAVLGALADLQRLAGKGVTT